MIHPNSALKFIDETVGYGVFATEFIPEGTIVYVKDSLEIEVTPEAFHQFDDILKASIEKYSYMDERGIRIISWDAAKYVNHCCQCNSISTGYGFEIAIKDIFPNEQITDEYGIFNLSHEIPLSCGKQHCRKVVRPEDFELYYQEWDEKIRKSLQKFKLVDQPLYSLLDPGTKEALENYFSAPGLYKSVYTLKHQSIALDNHR